MTAIGFSGKDRTRFSESVRNFRCLFHRKTFRLAVSHTQPHVIVFMGDLMDEGSVANAEEFRRYVNRFKDIFHVPNDIAVS